jgi:hypothetical protein
MLCRQVLRRQVLGLKEVLELMLRTERVLH